MIIRANVVASNRRRAVREPPLPEQSQNERRRRGGDAMGKFPAEQNTGQRLKVFVSAGAQELSAECSAARQVIARMQLTPVLFDVGGPGRAGGHPPRELSRTYLPQCQVFVG